MLLITTVTLWDKAYVCFKKIFFIYAAFFKGSVLKGNGRSLVSRSKFIYALQKYGGGGGWSVSGLKKNRELYTHTRMFQGQGLSCMWSVDLGVGSRKKSLVQIESRIPSFPLNVA